VDKRFKRLKDEIDVTEFYREMLDWDGKSNMPCPFPSRHGKGEDAHPSLKLFVDTGGCYCHGCGYKATHPVYFYADLKGCSFNKALRSLWSRYVEKLVPPDAYRIPAEKLMANPLVLSKLEKLRGITRETAKRFRLGYDGKRLTIPIFNEEGWCVNIRRYDLFKDGGPKMVSWKEGYGGARLFPLESLRANNVYVVEGELDAILAVQHGLSAITPAGGAMTWKSEWSKLFAGKKVYVIPDNDPPGLRGADIRRLSLSKHAASVKVVRLPVKLEKEDLTDWFMTYGGSAQKLRDIIGSAPQKTASSSETSPSSGKALLSMENSKSEEQLLLRADAVWDHLISSGAFFKNSANELFYVRDGFQAMKVSKELGPFSSYLTNLSPLINQATTTGKFIFQHILNQAYNQSALSKTGVWSMYDSGRLLVCAGEHKLLQLGGSKSQHIKNALNPERILLDMPVPEMAVRELPNPKPAEGLMYLRDLFMKSMPMTPEDRYMTTCWLMGVFLRDYIKPKPIVRLLAKTASGKSTVTKLVSILVYGEELLSHSASTLAATYEMANRYPVLMMDNMETNNMINPVIDFLLVAATGGMKAKRQVSSDRGIIMERTDCLVLTNGIEPFNRHELIDRTLEIGLDIKSHGLPSFQESRIFGQLKAHRQEILSAIMFLMHRYVLPRIRQGEVQRIMKEFIPHGKERFNEYLALMTIFLDALWGYMPLPAYRRPNDLVNYWLRSQTKALETQDEGTSEVLYYLNTLHDKHPQLMGASLKFEQVNGDVVLRAATRELLTDFRLLARLIGTRCPWQNERQLGARIADSAAILKKAGWARSSFIRNGKLMYKYVKEGHNGGGQKG